MKTVKIYDKNNHIAQTIVMREVVSFKINYATNEIYFFLKNKEQISFKLRNVEELTEYYENVNNLIDEM